LQKCHPQVANLKLRITEKNVIAELAVAKQHFFKKIAELRLRKRFLDVAEVRLQTLKKLCMPISVLGVLLTYSNLRKPICLCFVLNI
jgi:hypothetical protein